MLWPNGYGLCSFFTGFKDRKKRCVTPGQRLLCHSSSKGFLFVILTKHWFSVLSRRCHPKCLKVSLLQKQEPHFGPALDQLLSRAMKTLFLLSLSVHMRQREFLQQRSFSALTIDRICLLEFLRDLKVFFKMCPYGLDAGEYTLKFQTIINVWFIIAAATLMSSPPMLLAICLLQIMSMNSHSSL